LIVGAWGLLPMLREGNGHRPMVIKGGGGDGFDLATKTRIDHGNFAGQKVAERKSRSTSSSEGGKGLLWL